MNIWKDYIVGELCEVGRGSSPRPILDQKYFVNGNIPWIKIADATASGKYIYETKEYVNEYGASFSRHLEPDSLIIAASGVSLGQIKFLGVKGCIHDGWLYVSNYKTELIDKDFFYYFLINYSSAFHNFSSGAAIQNINTEILRNTKIKLPPILIQRKIASILSSYDELIENNNQRIKLLEEMAEEIYKEWFVRLRFPDYENTKFFDADGKEVEYSAPGTLPDGWESGTLGDLVMFKKGKNITQDTVEEGNIPVVAGGLTPAYFHSTSNASSPLITISASGANAGYVNIYYEDIWASDCSFIDTNATPFIFFFYMALKNRQAEVFFLQKGSAQPHVYPKDIMSLKMPKPSLTIIEKFEDLVTPFFEEIKLLAEKNRLLQQTRDLLLPRLISGKLSMVHLLEKDENLSMVAEPEYAYGKN